MALQRLVDEASRSVSAGARLLAAISDCVQLRKEGVVAVPQLIELHALTSLHFVAVVLVHLCTSHIHDVQSSPGVSSKCVKARCNKLVRNSLMLASVNGSSGSASGAEGIRTKAKIGERRSARDTSRR
jgi:hypothetical protein